MFRLRNKASLCIKNLIVKVLCVLIRHNVVFINRFLEPRKFKVRLNAPYQLFLYLPLPHRHYSYFACRLFVFEAAIKADTKPHDYAKAEAQTPNCNYSVSAILSGNAPHCLLNLVLCQDLWEFIRSVFEIFYDRWSHFIEIL